MATIGVGTHDVEVIGTKIDESKNHTEFVGVQFANEAGDTIVRELYLSPAAYDRTEADLAKLGWSARANDHNFALLNADPSPIRGNRAEIVVTEEMYNNTPRLKVKWINTPGERIAPTESAYAVELSERVKNRILNRVVDLPPGEDADSIPF